MEERGQIKGVVEQRVNTVTSSYDRNMTNDDDDDDNDGNNNNNNNNNKNNLCRHKRMWNMKSVPDFKVHPQ